MLPFYFVLLVFGAAVVFYLYRFLSRVATTFGLDMKRHGMKIALWILTGCLAGFFALLPNWEVIVLLHFLAAALLIQFFNFLAKKLAGRWYRDSIAVQKLYGSGLLPVLLTAVILLGGYWNMHNVVQTDYTISTAKDIREEGYTVALIADVHYGVSLDYEQLMEVCEEMSAQKPDVVILCGDIVDDSVSKAGVQAVFRALGTIESTYGSFYVYGNHDRPMSMLRSEYTGEDLLQAITDNGITVLKDEVYPVTSDFVLVGRDDRGYGGSGRQSIRSLLQAVSPDAFILTLDHQPNEYKENGQAGTDLLLSGHTHGGQLWPANLIDGIFGINDAVYGHTYIDEDTQAIVTSGFAGWRWPIKTAAPAEYVIIHIQKRG